MAKVPPRFDFFYRDFVHGVRLLDAESIGAYIMLLCHQFDEGVIPRNRRVIERICQCSAEDMDRIWPKIQGKFTEVDGGFINERMAECRAESFAAWKNSMKKAENNAKAGSKGGQNTQQKRKNKQSECSSECSNECSSECSSETQANQEDGVMEVGGVFSKIKEGGPGEEKRNAFTSCL